MLSLALAGCQQAADQAEPEVPEQGDSVASADPSEPPVEQREQVPTSPLVVDPPMDAPEGMVWVPGGTFQMGNPEEGQGDDRYVHTVELDGFYMDITEVTNRQFKEFVDATGYLTIAERTPKAEDFADQVADISQIPKENLVPGSICFNPNFDRENLRKDHPLWPYQVWMYTKGANWKHPDGPGSTVESRMDHPVVHVAWLDVVEYCRWAGKQLPTEAQWEYAARGGLDGKMYPWGDEMNPDGKWYHNVWQGEFPLENKVLDGFTATSPVKTFPANGYGLYDMSGNVWEWCADYYRPDYYENSPRRNPPGPVDSFDPQEPHMVKRVQRGGSFMCNANYCVGYRCATRMKGEVSSGSFHNGFRTVLLPGRIAEYQKAPAQQLKALASQQ